jgi:YD repeat-containing protein
VDNTYGVYTYTYDALGNLLTKTDPTLNKFTYSYDNLYRPVSENVGGKVSAYSYDTCTYGKGKVCSVTNSDYTQNISYKPTGDIASESKTIDSKTFTNSYTYDSLGQVTSITLPDTSTINYSYDNNGKQKTATLTSADGKTTNFVTDAKYNIDGTIKDITYGNGTKSCYNYSTTNGSTTVAPRLSDIYSFVGTDCATASKTNPKNLFAENLSYNKEGAIIGKTNRYANESSDIVSTFTYDELNRLTSSIVLQNNLNVVNNIYYSPIGNILSSDSVNYSYSLLQNANPNAPTSIGNKTLAYDPNGNVLTDGKNMYNWTEKNTLAKQENDKSISQYLYDINGERIKETVKVKSSATETSQYSVNENVYTVAAQAAQNHVRSENHHR